MYLPSLSLLTQGYWRVAIDLLTYVSTSSLSSVKHFSLLFQKDTSS